MRIFSTVFERKTHVAYAIIEMKKAETAFKIVKKRQKHEKNALYMKKCGKNGSREKNKRKRKCRKRKSKN